MRTRLAIPLLLAFCHGPLAAQTPDAAVMQAVLSDFTARKDTMSLHEDGVLLIEEQTVAWNKEKAAFNLPRRAGDKCPIGAGFVDALIARNPASESAAALIPQSSRWRLLRAGDVTQELAALDKAPDGSLVKSIAAVGKPAYSEDGNTALVLFAFRWSRHGAMAKYFVHKADNAWRTQCTELVFYP